MKRFGVQLSVCEYDNVIYRYDDDCPICVVRALRT